jgi:plastocyanin
MKEATMKTHTLLYRFLSTVTLLALLLSLSPTPFSVAQQASPPLPSALPSTALPNWAQSDSTAPESIPVLDLKAMEQVGTTQAAASSNAVYVDLRDHGPDPETTIALVGQSVVWTNNGTQSHTITEGDPIFPIYLPLVLRGAEASVVLTTDTTSTGAFDADHTPLFDSETLEVGESFTHTFATAGTFNYYSTYSPGRVVGNLIVVQPGEMVSETVSASSGATVTTTTGANLEIGAGVLLTDTVASITGLPDDVLFDTEGTPAGTVYNVEIVQSDTVISGSVTITLPYDPALVPPGTDSSELEIAYFNGLSWIGLGGVVDDVNHTASITTTHLSLFGIFKRCEPAFSLTHEEREAYQRAKDFMSDVLKSQDVYEAFKTSDGKSLFELPYNGRNARWLGTKSLCRVTNSTPAEIKSGLGIDATAQEVVDTMVALGGRLSYAGDDHEIATEIVDFLSEASLVGYKCLHVLRWVEHGGRLFSPAFLKVYVIVEALKGSALLYFDHQYSGKMSEKETEIANWLQSAEQMGQSNLDYVTERTELLADGCVPTEDYNGGFYEITVCGSNRADPPCTLGYVNLFQQGNDLRFVVGIHGTWPFYGPGFPLPDPTDRFYILVEYEDTNGYVQGSILRFENYKTRPMRLVRPCTTVAGMVSLPNARAGTDIKIKHIFMEDGHLDTRVAVGGVQDLLPTGKPMTYQPPNVPASPTPADGATDQDAEGDLSWSLDNPNGRSVTYDLYFEPADEDNIPDELASDDQTESTYDPGTLDPNTTYTWQVIATDDQGLAVAGPVWDFTTEEAPSEPVTMDQVYTADYWENPKTTFRPGEAIRLALQATNHTDDTIDVTYDWLTSDPHGAQVPYLSYSDWTVPMPPGEGTRWFLTRAVPSDGPLGWYTYNAFVSYGSERDSGFSVFSVAGTPISINLLVALTCKDVQNTDPVDVTSTFNTNDEYVYVWSVWEGASGAHTVRWEWYRPDETLLYSYPYSFSADEDLWFLWAWMPVSSMGNDTGQWSTEVYMDDILIDTVSFTLEAGMHSNDQARVFTPGMIGAGSTSSPLLDPVVLSAPMEKNDRSSDVPHMPR